MSEQAEAWRIHHGSLEVAVALPELAEVLRQPRIHQLPLAPPCFQEFLFWRQRIVPLVDLSLRLGVSNTTTRPRQDGGYLCILAYPDNEGVSFGALHACEPPADLAIHDDMECPLPHPAAWHEIALSCIEEQGIAIPILDLKALFSSTRDDSK